MYISSNRFILSYKNSVMNEYSVWKSFHWEPQNISFSSKSLGVCWSVIFWWVRIKMEEQYEEINGGRDERRSLRGESCEELRHYMYCIFSNLCIAAYNIVSKVSLDEGMSRYVLVAYGQLFWNISYCCFSIFLRKVTIFLSRFLLFSHFSIFSVNFFSMITKLKEIKG